MAEGEQTINLKILSPSTEVEGGVNLADVPASTTVKELRSRIQNAVPSKPATDRMRLIYRGRVVANDAETLGNVFGTDNIRENKDQSLHLVLRELPANENPPFRPPQSPAALPTNPFRTTPQPRPNPQSPTPHHHHHHLHPHAHHHHHLAGQGNPLPLLVPLPVQQLARVAAQQGNRQAPGQANEQTEHGTPAQPGGPVPSSESQTPPPSGLPNLPGNSERPLQRNPFDPTGARWTVTYNQVNIPAGLPPAPFPIPPALGFGRLPIATGTPPPGLDNNQRLLPRLQRIFQETLREMENVRTLLHTPAEQGAQAGTTGLTSPASPSIPVWRIDQLRRQLNTVNQNLNVIERGLALFPTDPDAAALRRSATMLRVDALELSMLLDRQPGTSASQTFSLFNNNATTGFPSAGPSTVAPGAPVMTPAIPMTFPRQTRNTTQSMPADAPAELFLLSSPQGPVGILFDHQGTYTMAPTVPTLPFQTFSDQFAQNRQLLAGLGYQMAQGANQLQNQLANLQPTPTQQPTPGGQAQNQNQMQNQNQPQDANANANPPGENDRMVNVAGHLWLIFKLAAFVYFFSGGGGLYRPIMLGIVAGIVYLAQVGVFQDQFNLLRHHFEALLAVGAMAERVAQPNNHAQQRGNLTPEEAAQRILQQRRDQRFGWVRDSMRTVERAFALFIASLFPGVGERMVHAQEERERQERVAAQEERERQEEEARRRQEEAQAEQQRDSEKKDEAHVQMGGDASVSGTSKGKERAETEIEASGSAA
ncbi:Ubiquitin protein [Pyrenophora tritici-repentis]|uniref:Ubiquitin protein n=1 Tax=Pyrenophora tritici-repentis TaxID=45151 RepID=A0A922SX19_9PLEO|nr:Ubiquitin protein [Pyrenophora tritici-repentis]KAI1670898.1 Ubiquitin protein [Pyrenophora tritici-repentis]KAI1684637.1 Ubiquitin protein [Pyrenophora tritici-repentis]